MRRLTCLALLLVGSTVSVAFAQDVKAPWEEFDKRLKVSQSVGALDDELFGDSVSLPEGSLSFSATDIELPGNDGLRVAFSRKYSVYNRWQYPSPDFALGDWDLDVPNISGIFAPNWTIGTPLINDADGRRCSLDGMPTRSTIGDYSPQDFWHGNTLSIPGVVNSELLSLRQTDPMPSTGTTYRWTTSDRVVRVSCLSSVQNTTGEGFLAITADGTKYWFDWMAQYGEPNLGQPGPSHPPIWMRKKNVLYATKVQDRFGNTVTYTYANSWNARAKLTAITGSDGRQITIDYNGSKISAIHANGKTWTYAYNGESLREVVLPDTSKWTINFAALTNAYIEYQVGSILEPARNCMQNLQPAKNYQDETVGTITHPSGAVGTFRVGIREHGRSNVPIACENVVTTGSGPPGPGPNDNDPNDDINAVAISYDSLTLLKKTISGPGVAQREWNYSYAADISWRMPPGGTIMWPVCYPWSSSCLAPDCLSDDCAGSAKATITGPGNDWVRYTYGNSYNYNEGKLLKVERGSDASNVLRIETNRYDLSLTDQAYPATAGGSARGSHEGFASEYTRPLLQADIWQQSETFSRINQSFDFHVRPLQVTRTSTLGDTRTETTVYSDNLSKWVMGQIGSVACIAPTSCAGTVESKVDYDAASALPIRIYGPGTAQTPGKLRQTLTYRTDGTIATVKDGNSNTIAVSNWKRGIPQTIQYPATPDQTSGASQSIVVDDNGWVGSVTDENGYATSYGYDAMGRVTNIAYPAGDSPAWTATAQAFVRSTLAKYGLPIGHWQQTVHTGNGYKVVYLDAMWRPVVEESYDSGNVAGTRSIVIKRYDASGRLAFQSYPLRSVVSYTDAALKGIRTFYDALGRVIRTEQDSEIGVLATTTEYLPDFKIRVKGPRQQGTSIATTTSFTAWDAPTTDYPAAIAAPEGVYVDIARDAFGKPLSIKRRNATDSTSVTRSYVYNARQELCKTIEPETASTLMAYDNAGNLSWTAGGQNAPSTSSCDIAPVAERTTRTYDARNRVKSLVFPDNRGNTTYTYTPDGLAAIIATNVAGADNVITSYTYNKRRLPTKETLQVGAFTWPLTYAYNGNGHLVSQTYPDGLAVAYAPNALGQPTGAGSYATGVTYHPNGGMAGFTYGNGVVHTMQQNTRQLPDRSIDSGDVLDDSYAYDGNGNVAAISDGLSGYRGDRDMTYDQLDRLTTTTSPMFTGGALYTYDVLDNLVRVKAPGRDHTYVYDGKWRLTNVTNTSGGATVVGMDYDAQGNLSNKSGQLFDFDRGNRLREAIGKERYVYDGHGRRVQATHPALGSIYSMYGQDGVLRFQRDERKGTATDYITLNGSLVAQVKNTVAPPVPALIAPGYVTTGSYTVSWNSVTSATRYELQERANGGTWAQIQSSTALSKAVSGKLSGIYDYRVRACNAECGGWSGTATVAVELPPDGIPALTAPSPAIAGNYTVSWTAPGGAESYDLQESVNGAAWVTAYSGTALSKVYSGKAAGSYGYRIRACNPAGCTSYSASKTVKAVYVPTSAPTITLPATTTTGSYTVSWTTLAGADNYELEQQVNVGAWAPAYTGAASSKAYSGVAPAVYGYRVRACNAAGCGPFSAVKSITRQPTAAPTVTTPAATLPGTYTVTWTAVVSATSYRLEEQVNSGAWAEVQNSTARSKAYTGKGPGTYGYRARGCNTAGCGPYAAIKSTQVYAAATVTAPATSNTGNYTVSWTAVTSATAYRLEEKVGSGAWAEVVNAAVTSKAFAGKTDGVYQYRVRACNTAGCGAYSAAKTTTVTLPSLPPPVPTGLWGTGTSPLGTKTTYRLGWSASEGAASYELSNASLGCNGTALSCVFTRTGGYVPITFQVRACNVNGCSAWSASETTEFIQ